MTELGLGRLHSPDQNDIRFLMAAALPAAPSPRQWKYWFDGHWWGDQGSTSQCVEYSWHHWVNAGPVRPRGKEAPYWSIGSVYTEAQKEDEWEGTDYDGTSVRAGAKVLQALGYIETYLWAWDINTLIESVLTLGPVVVGTTWYEGMFEPDRRTGQVRPTGRIVGGHAYVITGASRKSGKFRFKNSWSRGWGLNGRFTMTFEDFEMLLNDDGEACLAVEKRV